jgi:hypothetical protein
MTDDVIVERLDDEDAYVFKFSASALRSSPDKLVDVFKAFVATLRKIQQIHEQRDANIELMSRP